MPVIPIVGRKSFRTRALIGSLYLVLTIGAITMVYPFMLMLTTATTSIADWREFRLIPDYLTSRIAQFRKYVVEKNSVGTLAYQYAQDSWYRPENIETKQFDYLTKIPEKAIQTIDRDYADFMAQVNDDLKYLQFIYYATEDYSVLSVRHAYFQAMKNKYGSLDRVNSIYDDTAGKWEELGLPRDYNRVWDYDITVPRHVDWRQFVISRPYPEQYLLSLDELAFIEVRSQYGSVRLFNEEFGTSFKYMTDIRWSALSNQEEGRKLQLHALRWIIPLSYIRLNSQAKEAFAKYLAETSASAAIPFTTKAPVERNARRTWMGFARSKYCLLEYFDPIDPQALWHQFLNDRYQGSIEALNTAHAGKWSSFDDIRLPYDVVDYVNFTRNHWEIFKKFLLGNFSAVLDFVFIHGRALWNTIILVVLTILTTLTVNPMAAYVLSRFRLKYANHVLIFLLAVMAFPTEVAMIPGFLLVKSFPLGAIILGISGMVMFFVISYLTKLKLPMFWSILIGTACALLAGWFGPPVIARWIGREDLNVSLLNTFVALVLPGIAQGFAIFLLKGFFDSLPPELYEAAMLDGASETRMFVSVTLPLCKPVLAVIALTAFTTAYGAFMFAFLTCQDPKMWTLMVFLYEFQQTHSVPVVMASLVISAMPTLLVFVFCQNIILRGIVIPTFK
ncbi:MAG: carbohydrate ABC transporter permease [Planctomycetes bacterium]|nr:carbohydrate ABC transporter permease [Planctomycetota bacterium]